MSHQPIPNPSTENSHTQALQQKINLLEQQLSTARQEGQFLTALANLSLIILQKGLEGMADVLSTLGRVGQVSRVYIFENFTHPQLGRCMRQRYEWVAEGIESYLDAEELQALPYSPHFEDWYNTFKKGEMINIHVPDLDPIRQEIMQSQNIKSMLLMPIFVEDTFYGFLGFDDCLQYRTWRNSDKEVLQTASILLGSTLTNDLLVQRMQRSLNEAEMLYQISAELARAATLKDILAVAVKPALSLGAVNAGLLVLDFTRPSNQGLIFLIENLNNLPLPFPEIGHNLNESPLAPLWQNMQEPILLVDDLNQAPNLPPQAQELLTSQGWQACVFIGLQSKEGYLGEIIIGWERPQNFANSDKRLYRAVALLAQTAVRNHVFTMQAQRRARHEQLVNHINQKIQQSMTVEGALKTALRELGQALNPESLEVNVVVDANPVDPVQYLIENVPLHLE
jgi:GAF domain-containing protein